MWCAVKTCSNGNRKKPGTISLFSFPTDPKLLKQWISFCCRKNKINPKNSRICMEHFKPEDFENNLQYEMGFTKRRFLKRGAVPSIRKASSTDEDDKGREERIQKRENKKIVEMLMKQDDSKPVSMDDVNETPVECQFFLDPKMHHEENMECIKKEIDCLRYENKALKETTKKEAAELRALQDKRAEDCQIYKYKLKGLSTQLTKTEFELTNLEEQLSCFFTKSQIAKMKSGGKRTIWTKEDITQAATLYTTSAKLYKLLLSKQFPLPAIRTLQAWRQVANTSVEN